MTAPDVSSLLFADDVRRSYGTPGAGATDAVAGITAYFDARRMHVITGPSGSGKSTLLNLLSGLDRPTSGRVLLHQRDLSQLSQRQLARLRQREIGFVFQRFNLVPSLTAADNIRLPQQLVGRRVDELWFSELVETLGLADRLGHRPGELSGGQQQRVAVARALLGRPAVVFADEPTGSLDRETGAHLITLLRRLTDEHGVTSVSVTHDERLAARADRELHVVDGQVAAEQGLVPTHAAGTSMPPASADLRIEVTTDT